MNQGSEAQEIWDLHVLDSRAWTFPHGTWTETTDGELHPPNVGGLVSKERAASDSASP